MISENQVRRLLKHCSNIKDAYDKLEMCGDEGPEYFDMCTNEGWVQALRLVLNMDTKSINNKELDA